VTSGVLDANRRVEGSRPAHEKAPWRTTERPGADARTAHARSHAPSDEGVPASVAPPPIEWRRIIGVAAA
jgi:hypothetical protein